MIVVTLKTDQCRLSQILWQSKIPNPYFQRDFQLWNVLARNEYLAFIKSGSDVSSSCYINKKRLPYIRIQRKAVFRTFQQRIR